MNTVNRPPAPRAAYRTRTGPGLQAADGPGHRPGPGARTLFKVCGAMTPADVAALHATGADLVGLWHGIPGGRAELPITQLVALAEAVRATRQLSPVLVTFLNDVEFLARALDETGIRWVQLHAFQPPALVRRLRAAAPDVTIVKVLHVREGWCAEGPLLPAYERAGTDLFLLDSMTEDGRVGSTGRGLREADVLSLAGRLNRLFLLAGGIAADNRDRYRRVVDHPLFYGIDVDTAARDGRGRFRRDRVRAIACAWSMGRHGEDDSL